MKRVILAGFAGAAVYFVWQMLTWMVIPLHGPTVSGLPNETAVREALTKQNLESGVYIVPFGTDEEMMDPESDFATRHKTGPLFSIYYHKEGLEPMMTSILVVGFLIDFLSAALAALLLCCAMGGCCCKTYMQRVGFVTALGVFWR